MRRYKTPEATSGFLRARKLLGAAFLPLGTAPKPPGARELLGLRDTFLGLIKLATGT
jgi:hypothetical protein